MAIGIQRFENITLLNESVAALLKHHFEREYPKPHAVMLSGGRTPLAAYRLLADGPEIIVSSALHLFFSDERLLPENSPASNFANARFLAAALRLDESRVLRVNSELEPEPAAARYDAELGKFINSGGRITLGLLGLGADGHTASLFSREDVARGRGKYALATTTPDGVKRVSVSADLLSKIEQIVFVVSGPEKKAVAEKLVNQPSSLPAGLAVAGVKNKQVWFAA